MPATLTADSITQAAQTLSLSELETVVEHLITLRAHRRTPALSQQEAELLQRIETAVPLMALQQRKALRTILAQRPLTADELSELAELTDAIETAEAGRFDLLSELAALRGVSPTEVARQLGLAPA